MGSGICRLFMPYGRVNIAAILSGILFLYVLYSGDYWWVSYGVGAKPTFVAGVAPYRIDIVVLGRDVDIPAIPFIELSGLFTYIYVSIACLLAGFFPRHRYLRTLVGFRTILVPMVTHLTIYIGVFAVANLFGLNIPFVGESVVTMKFFVEGYDIVSETPVASRFTDTFYLVVLGGILALFARFFMRCVLDEEEA